MNHCFLVFYYDCTENLSKNSLIPIFLCWCLDFIFSCFLQSWYCLDAYCLPRLFMTAILLCFSLFLSFIILDDQNQLVVNFSYQILFYHYEIFQKPQMLKLHPLNHLCSVFIISNLEILITVLHRKNSESYCFSCFYNSCQMNYFCCLNVVNIEMNHSNQIYSS